MIGLYPGSFDPITLGHEDIINRAVKICNKLVVAVSQDNQKSAFLSSEQRINLIKSIYKNYTNIEVQNLEKVLIEKLGTKVISRMFELKYLKIAPAMQSGASDEKIRQSIISELTKIKARQGIEKEISDALEDLKGDADEGITWRVSQAAEANNAANKIQKDETNDEFEKQKVLSEKLQSLIDNEVWIKKKTN